MKIEHIHFNSVDSTNTWAKQNASAFKKNKLYVISAAEQTAGRGRFKRLWESPRNLNLYVTYCFFIDKHSQLIGNISQVIGISAARCLESLDLKPQLKWPNDVLVNDKKIAGILCESTPLADQLCLVVGIGLNVNMPLERLQKIDRPATSLIAETGQNFTVDFVLKQLTTQFHEDLTIFLDAGFLPFLPEYTTRIKTYEKEGIRFHDSRIVWEGKFHSIKQDGSLNLLLNDGTVRNFISGEILF